MADSDSLYHRLFSYAIMIEGLVREFVPDALGADIDFARIQRVQAKFHSRTGQRRESDVIWRLPTGLGTDIYLYLLLEFQSRIDWWMAVRIQVYAGLLWQQIIGERRLKPGDRLPPVLPIVLFNGDPRWNAPAETTALVALPPGSPLWPWQPRVRYHLLDEGAFAGGDLAGRDSLVALLFRLEHCRQPQDLAALVDEVIGWFRRHPDYEKVKHLFAEVVRQAAENTKAEGVTVPEDMLEIRTMLAERAKEWRAQWIAEGLAAGKAEGKAEILLRLLGRRFGPLPPGIEEQVGAADNDLLDAWSDRLLDARTVTDVFLTDRQH